MRRAFRRVAAHCAEMPGEGSQSPVPAHYGSSCRSTATGARFGIGIFEHHPKSEAKAESDAPPAGDKAVYAFLELFALAFTFEGASALLRGESLWRIVGAWLVAIIFFIAGIQWPKSGCGFDGDLDPKDRTVTDRIDRTTSSRTGIRFTPRSLIVPAAVVVVAFIAAALFYFPRAKTEGPLAIKSLAVLPLKSLDAGENYLGRVSPTQSSDESARLAS